MHAIRNFAAALMTFAALSTSAAPPTPSFHVIRHIPIPGDGGWDYLTVDSEARRLYVSHSDHVAVIDLDKGTVVGEIPKTEGVHGVAIAPSVKRGFVSAGRTSSVTIFETGSLKASGEVKTTGEGPDAILFDAVSSRVFTFNGRGRNVTAIDPATGAVAGTIDVGGKPEFAVPDGRGTLFVNIEDTNELVAIDAKSLKVTARWSLAPCEEPSGLAIDTRNRRLFSVCANKLMAISDADGRKIDATVPIGAGVDGAGFDSKYALAFSSNGADGTLTVVRQLSPDKYDVAATVTTARGARTMVIDEKTHHIFLTTAKFGPAPSPTTEHPHPRPSIVPGSVEVIELAP